MQALLLQRFVEVCQCATPHVVLPPSDSGAIELRSYRDIKQHAVDYQARKAAFMREKPFHEWVCAPESCEMFSAQVDQR